MSNETPKPPPMTDIQRVRHEQLQKEFYAFLDAGTASYRDVYNAVYVESGLDAQLATRVIGTLSFMRANAATKSPAK